MWNIIIEFIDSFFSTENKHEGVADLMDIINDSLDRRAERDKRDKQDKEVTN